MCRRCSEGESRTRSGGMGRGMGLQARRGRRMGTRRMGGGVAAEWEWPLMVCCFLFLCGGVGMSYFLL